jgi:hypothetical protein
MPKYEFTVVIDMDYINDIWNLVLSDATITFEFDGTLDSAEKLQDEFINDRRVTFAAFHEVKPEPTEASDDTQDA